MFLGKMITTLEARSKGFKGVRKDLLRIQRETEGVDKKWKKWGKTIQMNSERMMRIGYFTSMYLTLPILGAAAATLMLQKRFNVVFKRMEILLGNTRSQVQRFKKEILEMAPGTGQGPFAIANALQIIQQEGVGAEEAMGLVKDAAMGATLVGSRQMGIFANAIANVRAAMKTTSGEAAKFVTKWVGREGINVIWRMGEGFGELGATATAVGVSLNEIGGVLGVLTDRGRRFWRVAGDLDSVFDTLISSTSALGVSLRKTLVEEGLVAFLDRIGEMKGIPDLFGRGGRRVILGLLQNIEDVREEVQMWEGDVRSIDDMMDQFRGTVEYQFRKALSTLETTFVDLGRTIKVPMIQALQWLNDWLTKVTNKVRNMSQVQIDNMLTIAKWTALMGPVIMILGLLGSLIGSAIGLIAKFAWVITKTLSPLGMLITAGALLVGWLIKLGIAHNKEMKQMKETKRLVSEYGKAMNMASGAGRKATEKMREQRGELGSLQGALKNVSAEMKNIKDQLDKAKEGTVRYKTLTQTLAVVEDERKEIISDLNSKFGKYLDNEIKAGMAYSKIAIQLKKVNNQLERRIKIKATEAAREEIMSKMVSLQRTIWKNEKNIQNTKYQTSKAAYYDFELTKQAKEINESILESLRQQYGELTKMLNKLTGSNEESKSVTEEVEKWKQFINDLNAGLEDTVDKLRFIAEMERALGSDYEFYAKMTDFYRSKIGELAKEMASVESVTSQQRDRMQELVAQYKSYKVIADIIESSQENMEDAISLTNDAMEEQQDILDSLPEISMPEILPEGFEELKAKIEAIAQITQSIFTGMFRSVQRSITDTLRSSEKGLGDFAKMMGDILKNLFNRLVATAIAAFMLALALKAIGIPIGGINIGGVALKQGVDFGKIFGAFFGQGMQHGGVVPDKYGTDQYPAWLSGGEMVIPPEDIDRGTLGVQEVIVHGYIDGETIYLTNEEYKRKKGNTL